MRTDCPVRLRGDPARVTLVADAVSAYLLDALDLDHTRWTTLLEGAAVSDNIYSIDNK